MSRLIIVSNRLPITVRPGAAVEVEPSSGGLVSALVGLAETGEYEGLVWVGWPGSFVPSEAEEKRLTALINEDNSMKISMVPIWLSQADVEEYYNGYSNSSLWPLLHWMTPYARFKKSWADSYRRVNERFADAVFSTATASDTVWVQDFHLFLVPQLLRRKQAAAGPKDRPIRPKDLPPAQEEDFGTPQSTSKVKRPADLPSPAGVHARFVSLDLDPISDRGNVESALGSANETAEPDPEAEGSGNPVVADAPEPVQAFPVGESGHFMRTSGVFRPPSRSRKEKDGKLKIAFFLHVPFPSYEVICSLPQCAEIVEGVLGADLVGFHTYSYLRHFRSCIVRLCGFAPEIDHVEHRGQRTKLVVNPIGASCSTILKAMKTPRFAEHLSNYTTQFQGKCLVLSVERLDYSKGMPQKLGAIERYLELTAEREAERARAAKREEEKPRREEPEEEEEDTPVGSFSPTSEECPPVAGRGFQGRLEDWQKKFQGRKAKSSGDHKWRISTRINKWLSGAGGFWGKDDQGEKKLDHASTVFLFVAVPSRQEVDQYKAIELEVHRRISDINGRFSTPHYQPIVYIHRSVPMEELTALYARADCCMVTPLVDGMNLVAKEFLVAKDRSKEHVVPGTIVLSELAGAAQELFDAIVVNPYDEDAVAEAIALGLELTRGGHLDEDLRWEITEKMREACLKHDSAAWARTLLDELQDGAERAAELDGAQPKVMRTESESMHFLNYTVASLFFENKPGTKALFLDYDGTLREFEPNAEDAVPSDDARRLFRDLAEREDLRVFILSGRSKEFLEEHFGDCQTFTLIAEHGHYERGPNTGHEWRMFNPYTNTDWIIKVRPIMDLFMRCTPGSTIEMKESAILWHYEKCDEEFGQFKAKELMHQLALSLGNLPCQISQGPNVVEVCSLRITKGLIVQSICQEREWARTPFAEVLCMGDDATDESMFTRAPESAWTVKVGAGETRARHRLQGPAEVRRFLRLVAEQRAPSSVMPPKHLTQGPQGDSLCGYRSCQEDPRGSAMPRRESDFEGDPLEGLPEHETLAEGPTEGGGG